jgi:hypothetical protein
MSADMSVHVKDHMINSLHSSVQDIREMYHNVKERGDREAQREIIRDLWSRDWKPSVGFVADAVNEPRATISATVQRWPRG